MTASTAHVLPFSHDEFRGWYSEFSDARLRPAAATFCRLVSDLVASLEVENGRGRYREPISRIKDPTRLWVKMNSEKYISKIATPEDVPNIIDDLIGIRVVCINLADMSELRDRLDKLPSLDSVDAATNIGLAIEDGTRNDYVTSPKASGYRAFHVNLFTEVAQLSGNVRVRGELQVRSLLQDGWGELTHEDTYKPDQKVPDLVSTLSARMGELLATVDLIAEDIRKELAELARADVSDPNPEDPTPEERAGSGGTIADDVVRVELRRLVHHLSRPASLAHLAARLRATFGPATVDGWLGHPNFKSFLIESVPGIQVIPVGPSYVIPAGKVPDDSWPAELRQFFTSDPESTDEGSA